MGRFTGLFLLSMPVLGVVTFVTAMPSEPVCSKFDYEMKTLEAMLRTEQNVEKMLEEMKNTQTLVSKDLEELKKLKLELASDFELLAKGVDRKVLDQITKMNGELEAVTKSANDKLEELGGALQKGNDLVVAFSVRDPTKSLVNGVPTFKSVVTNIGEAYNMDTGLFTSPVDGLYIFMGTVSSSGKHTVYCMIKHNNDSKVLAYSNDDTAVTTAAASVFLLLSKGDTVSFGSCVNWNNVYDAYFSTTFGGALITQTS